MSPTDISTRKAVAVSLGMQPGWKIKLIQRSCLLAELVLMMRIEGGNASIDPDETNDKM